jgi:Protein kinase domain
MADYGQASFDNPNPRTSLASGVPVTDHELIRLIGRGSYGEVWLAKNTLGTFRAIKIVYEKTFRDKRPFEREFNGVKKFEPVSRLHEGLMDVLQVGRDDAAGYFYCVMELADDVVSGQNIDPQKYFPRTLAHDLTERGRLTMEECRRTGLAIASALEFLHARGLVHRDVKPGNVVFVNGNPKLSDIGLVAEFSAARSYVGTEGFIPPEGPGTVQADIYSLGKVLYEISTGKDRHEYPEPPTLIGDPAFETGLIEFNKIVLNACRPEPRQRYQSAAALRADLELLDDDGHSTFRKRGWFARSPVKKLAGALCVAALALAVVVSSRTKSSRTSTAATPVPVPCGLVAWWPADGNAADVFGGLKGQLMNGAGFARGKTGRAFAFNGIHQFVTVPSGPAVNLTHSLTMEGWVYVSGHSTNDFVAIAAKIQQPPEAQYCLALANLWGQSHFYASHLEAWVVLARLQ